MTSSVDPKERFSDRVADYVRCRPGYPPAVLDILREEIGLRPEWRIADVGAGTGISAELFLDNGNEVFAVEPNADMRRAAESRLGGRSGFHSVAGSAEDTGLDVGSVDAAVAAQAFHWFDAAAARRELTRVLRPPGWTVVLWNVRELEADAFSRDYEALLRRFGTDYDVVRHDRIGDARLEAFFAGPPVRRTVPNEQVFDYEGLRGRLLSSSYAPASGHPSHAPMLSELERIFERHRTGGRVRMLYETQLFIGTLGDGR